MITPYAPNKDFKTPEHADGIGQDEESYQLEDYRAEANQGRLRQLAAARRGRKEARPATVASRAVAAAVVKKQQKKGHVGGDKAVMKHAHEQETAASHTRVGKDSRVASHKDGAKIRMESDWVVVNKGKIIFSRPPIIGKDPIKNDDK